MFLRATPLLPLGVEPEGGRELKPSSSKPAAFAAALRFGALVGPGVHTGRSLRLRFSLRDEHLWWEGADPADGCDFWAQLRVGPCCWSMFVSCVGFALPGLIHLYKHEHWADWCAGLALGCVAVSSALCDAYCVHSGVYDSGAAGYERTARAVGRSSDWVAQQIKERGADLESEVWANDSHNNFTRLLDRAVCAALVFPAMVGFALRQRPTLWQNASYAGGFFLALAACRLDQRFRAMDPCGIRYMDGKFVVERTYGLHQRLHEVWHLVLIVTMCCSALDRP